MKKLLICFDGTWNNPEQEDNGIPSPTNVVKLYHSFSTKTNNDIDQLAFYHPGLGGEQKGLKEKVQGGALGIGVKRHISSAYHWLGLNYEEGDEVYIFGFSRGAFTARSLGGLLGYDTWKLWKL